MKSLIVTGRIVCRGGGMFIQTLDGKQMGLENIIPRDVRKEMFYDPETGWYVSKDKTFKITVEVQNA